MPKRGVEIPITAEDMTRAAFNSAAQNAKRLDKTLQQTGKASKQTTGQFRAMRGGLGQLGYQIQDVAVSLQGGQNAMLVLTQQGSQMASVFGPGGIVIGAILAVGGAIAATLLPKLFSATDASDDLTTALEATAAIAVITDGNILTLSESMAALADSSRDAAGVQLAAGVIQAEAAVTASVARIGAALEDEFGGFLEPSVKKAVEQFQAAEDAGLDFAAVMRAGMVPATKESEMLRHTVGDLKNEIVEISRTMGISAEEAYGLVGAYAAMDEEASQENISNFLGVVTALSPATEGASDELRGMQSELIVAQQAAERAAESLNKFREAQANFAESGALPKSEDENAIDKQNRDLYITGLMEQLEADRDYAKGHKAVQKSIQAEQIKTAAAMVSVTSQQMAQMTSVMDQGSAAGKAFFAVTQALAAANAVVNGLQASMAIRAAYAQMAATAGPAAPAILAAGEAHAWASKAMGIATAGIIMAQTVASFEGGGFTGPGARSGGMDGKGGFPAILHPNETVVDHTKGSTDTGGGGDVNFHIKTNDAKGFESMLQQNRGLIIGMVQQHLNAKGKRL